MKKHTTDFLKTLLWVADNPDFDERPLENSTIHDFSPEFIAGVEAFIDGFIAFLEMNHPDLAERLPDLERSLGGNVYLSLSGHGAGFFDERDDELSGLHEILKTCSGNPYRFEELESMLDVDPETGTVDLSYLPEFLPAKRMELFTVKH